MERLLGQVLAAVVVELPVRLAVEYPVGPADDALEEAVLAWPSDQPVEAPPLEEVVGAEPVAPPLEEGVGAEAVVLVAVVPVVLLAVVLVANNRYRSQGHGYRRCYRCRDRGRYHHPARRHRYRGAALPRSCLCHRHCCWHFLCPPLSPGHAQNNGYL